MNAKAGETLILEQLARINQSPQFAAAERQRRFLTQTNESREYPERFTRSRLCAIA